jgi:hypothetical protein
MGYKQVYNYSKRWRSDKVFDGNEAGFESVSRSVDKTFERTSNEAR